MTDFSLAIVIGRWQLPHLAHHDLIQKAFDTAERVMIVIGSSFRSRNPKNPFCAHERQAMLECMLNDEQRQRVDFLYVRDYFHDERWANAIREGVKAHHHDKNTALVGFKKDQSSYYLEHFPEWTYVNAGSRIDTGATAMRNVYFGESSVDAALTVMTPYVHPAVLDYLRAWSALPDYQARRDEHRAVLRYKEKYPGPYYLTADSILEVNGHILLVRRGGDIGHGQLALPGGFLDGRETFCQAAVRELTEETRFRTLATTMATALKGKALFDHPDRSPRGRLITHAFHFRLETDELPQVQGDDDAQEAMWWPIERLSEVEGELFEDHAVILDHFTGFMGR